MEKLYLTEAMKKLKKILRNDTLNIINTYTGSGKTHFVFNELINNTTQYTNEKNNYNTCLDKIMYVCDTKMLKDSILKDYPEITKEVGKGALLSAKENNSDGKILVITYSMLGMLLKSDANKSIIVKNFKCIIMDEIHNLLKYAYKFKNDEGKVYHYVLNIMNKLSKTKSITLIGMTATPSNMYYALKQVDFSNYKTLFNTNELTKIKKYYNEHEVYVKDIINEVKKIALYREYFIKSYTKILIYTNKISVAKKYKEILINGGFDAEYLCSLNNSELTERQLMIRDYIINKNVYPFGLDVLIINSAYETGWNLRDNNVKWILVDTIEEDTWIQARNRVRNDIVMFIHKGIFDDGILLDRDQYKNLYETGYGLSVPILTDLIDSKYINKKLTTEDKKEIVKTYGTIGINNKKVSWKNFKEQVEKSDNYKVVTCRKGTYIINKEEDINNILKGGNDDMKKYNELNEYLNNISGEKLNKQKQKELIDKIGLKDTRGRLQKSINILNSYLIDNCNKTIKSKRITIDNKKVTIWIVSDFK